MNPISKSAIKDIVAAVVGLLPGGKLIENTANTAAEIAISALSKRDQDEIQIVSKEIFKILSKKAEIISPEDPGRAYMAAYNVIDTIRKSQLDADRIIDCGLNPHEIYDYLLKFPAEGIDSASIGRRNIYQNYLLSFSEKVTDAVFSTAPFQRRLHQRLLQNQTKIMKMIEQFSQCIVDKTSAS
jgi:hypothetical protein